MLLDFETIAMLAGTFVMMILSIIALKHVRLSWKNQRNRYERFAPVSCFYKLPTSTFHKLPTNVFCTSNTPFADISQWFHRHIGTVCSIRLRRFALSHYRCAADAPEMTAELHYFIW